MSTYDHRKVLSEYANGRMAVEMAMGHSLQHINKLYEVQTAAGISRQELRAKVDDLEQEVKALRTVVERLTALIQTQAAPNLDHGHEKD